MEKFVSRLDRASFTMQDLILITSLSRDRINNLSRQHVKSVGGGVRGRGRRWSIFEAFRLVLIDRLSEIGLGIPEAAEISGLGEVRGGLQMAARLLFARPDETPTATYLEGPPAVRLYAWRFGGEWSHGFDALLRGSFEIPEGARVLLVVDLYGLAADLLSRPAVAEVLRKEEEKI